MEGKPFGRVLFDGRTIRPLECRAWITGVLTRYPKYNGGDRGWQAKTGKAL